MGCSCVSRNETTESELAILQKQRCIESQLDVVEIFNIFEDNCPDTDIDQKDVDNIIASIGYEKSPGIRNFFSSFKNSSGNYAGEKLKIFGIMIGKGDIKKKAKLLFLVYDKNKCGELYLYKVKSIFKAVIDISAIHLPELVENKEPRVIAYLNRIAKFSKSLLAIIMARINFVEEKITKNRFCSFLSTYKNSFLLQPTYIRRKLNDLADSELNSYHKNLREF